MLRFKQFDRFSTYPAYAETKHKTQLVAAWRPSESLFSVRAAIIWKRPFLSESEKFSVAWRLGEDG